MRLIFIFILIFNMAFSTEQFFNTEQSIFQNDAIQDEPAAIKQNSIAMPEEEAMPAVKEKKATFINWFEAVPFDSSENQTQNIYPKYVTYPNKIYIYQRFNIKIEALISIKEYTRVETRFVDGKNIAVINPQEPWKVGNSANTVDNSYFFKVYTPEFKMPKFEIVVYNNDEVVEVSYLEPQKIHYTNIAVKDNLFSNIIADDLKVISSKTKQYSNNELLTVLEIEAINGNLEDFKLKSFKEQTVMHIEENYPNQKLIYNAIIPIYTKSIVFNYYNIQTNSFKKITVPIKAEEELVSTQTDLNPNDSNVAMYKKFAAGAVALLFTLLYIWKRKIIYIIIAALCTLVFYIFAQPNDSIVIGEGTKIYILPTKNSTVFHITKSKQLAEVLNKNKDFTKILFHIDDKSKTVGWIKESNIVEN
ncbi:MAG: hypothetical protein ACNI3C_02745 [Candidatus Marinarcus sp.]|uniref:hypothetical protein n=1 Tax=Candidatus Marinarcus sp. TaxID=3100987 RepID=UPI003B000693